VKVSLAIQHCYLQTYNLQVLCLKKYATVNAHGLSRNMQHEQHMQHTYMRIKGKGLEERGEILRVAVKLIAWISINLLWQMCHYNGVVDGVVGGVVGGSCAHCIFTYFAGILYPPQPPSQPSKLSVK